MDGLTRIADSISADLKRRLPSQRKTQREKLALLVATMLDVRSANLMDLAAGLPRAADRTDMRYQWITRLLGNPLVVSDEIMEPFARERDRTWRLDNAASHTEACIDQRDHNRLWGRAVGVRPRDPDHFHTSP